MAAGSFLPWVQASFLALSVSRNGMQLGKGLSFSADGLVTLVLGLAVAVVALMDLASFCPPRLVMRSLTLAGIAGLSVGIYDYVSLSNQAISLEAKHPVIESVGYGLWAVIVGSGMVALLPALTWVQERRGWQPSPISGSRGSPSPSRSGGLGLLSSVEGQVEASGPIEVQAEATSTGHPVDPSDSAHVGPVPIRSRWMTRALPAACVVVALAGVGAWLLYDKGLLDGSPTISANAQLPPTPRLFPDPAHVLNRAMLVGHGDRSPAVMVANDFIANPSSPGSGGQGGPSAQSEAKAFGDEKMRDLDSHGYMSDYYEAFSNTKGLPSYNSDTVEVIADVIRFRSPAGAAWYFRRFRPSMAQFVGGLQPAAPLLRFSAGIGGRSIAMECCASRPFNPSTYGTPSNASVALMFTEGPYVVLVTGVDAFRSESEYLTLLESEGINSRIRRALGLPVATGWTVSSSIAAVSPAISPVRVRVCQTAFATPGKAVPVLPRVGLSVPSSKASALRLYVDAGDLMGAVGPKGWSCRARYSADGTGGLAISDPHSIPLGDKGATEGVSTSEYLCWQCAVNAACPYLQSARLGLRPGEACAATPKGEEVRLVSTTLVEFTDPRFVSGLGYPSGGPLAARGTLAYNSLLNTTSGEATYSCTLPASLQYVCVAGIGYANENPSAYLPAVREQGVQPPTVATPKPAATPQATPTPAATPTPVPPNLGRENSLPSPNFPPTGSLRNAMCDGPSQIFPRDIALKKYPIHAPRCQRHAIVQQRRIIGHGKPPSVSHWRLYRRRSLTQAPPFPVKRRMPEV
jgi:hypothetical protein